MMRTLLAAVLLAGLLTPLSWSLAAPPPSAVNGPLSPEEAIKNIVVPEGYRVELVAAEPEVIDPVDLQFDEHNRLWVAEYSDYPIGSPDKKPLSKIKLLEDKDGDGRYETSHVFADGLHFCNGLQPWQGGVIATLYGRIAYLKDTDGDSKADVDETWFTGFSTENSQLHVNHPRFALDNGVYVSNGLRGGSVLSTKHPEAKPVSVQGRDLRINPFDASCESVSGNGQFGNTFDDWGNRFICSNRNPMMHVVLADRYLRRNPLLAVPKVQQDVADTADKSHLFSLADQWTTFAGDKGQYTSACGVEVYRGNAFPAEFYGNAFICEPTASLVHREIVRPMGATFKAEPAYKDHEFFASRDSWCRPCNVKQGPDGAIYICDIYRKVIEHPAFLPPELLHRPDMRHGDDRGRIWRVVPNAFKRPATSDLGKLSSAELVPLLDHPNCWQRETAARLLNERQDKSVRPALEKLAVEGKTPQGRVQAMWTLQGLGGVEEPLLVSALGDENPRVIEQAVVLAEPRMKDSQAIEDIIFQFIINLDDSQSIDKRLMFQLALSWGEGGKRYLVGGEVPPIVLLMSIGLTCADDMWIRDAVGSSLGTQVSGFPGGSAAAAFEFALMALADAEDVPLTSGDIAYVKELATLTGATRNVEGIARVFDELAKLKADHRAEQLRFAALNGLVQGLQSKGARLAELADSSKNGKLRNHVDATFQRASAMAQDQQADDQLRSNACGLLGQAPFAMSQPILVDLLTNDPSQAMRLRAVSAMAQQKDHGVGKLLVETLPRQTPAVQNAILDAVLQTDSRMNGLLDAIEAGKLKPTALGPLRAGRLTKNKNPDIQKRAQKILVSVLPADREKALADYRPVLQMKSDPVHGKEVFRKNCSSCHKIDDVGVDVGPAITDLRKKTAEQVLTDVLQPNRAIDNNFVSYTVVTDDGNTYTGVISAETATSISIKLPDGKALLLLRSNIEELQSNGISLMPEGLEKNIPPQDMADVIDFVKNWRYMDGTIPVMLPNKN